MQSANIEPERVFKLLTLIAKAIHLSGEHSEVEQTFDTHGGSIGRQDECDMVLPDPDRRISRLQARILHVDGKYVVCNASTSNPMYVNGVELPPGSSQPLGDGDELRAGSYVVAVSQTEDASQQTASQADRPQASPMRADTVSQASPPEQGRASATADPLLAFGSNAGSGDDPFADLLGKAAPVDGATGAEPETNSMAQPLPAAVDDFAEKQAPEQSLSTPRDHSGTGQMADDSPVVQQMPSNTSGAGAVGKSERPNAQVRLTPAQDFDPNDPFGDLLAQAIPVRGAETAFDAAGSTIPAHDPNIGSAVWESGQPAQGFYPSNASPLPDASNAQENLFDMPAAPETLQTPRESGHLGDRALQALAGDPFADLMGAPVEEHMAHAPPFDPVSREYYIPNDFNPLASGGVAQRNSSDPLASMGLNANGLSDILPVETIDSLYRPGEESPTTLTVDPLKPVQERVLRVEQSTDPLKLFANNAKSLIPDDLGLQAGTSTRDDAREMVAYFRAPVPRVDHDMLVEKEEGIDDAKTSPLLDPVPTDPGAHLTPPDIALLPATGGGGEGDAFQSLPPSVGLSGTRHDAVAEESRQDSAQAAGAEPSDSNLSATRLPAATKQSDDSLSQGAGKSDERAAEELMAAFKRGAGLQELSATSVTPQTMEILGHLLKIAVQGAVSLLAARAAIKQEIHLSVTLINPSANNPMKFLPDGHTAMLQMLGPKIPGFMAPVEAMEEAFSDLLRHQTAIAAGTQATIEALFRRFDPDAIQSRYPKSGVGEKMSRLMYHARLWDLYVDQYRLIKDEIKDDFFKRLGSEFHDAYNREYEDGAGDK